MTVTTSALPEDMLSSDAQRLRYEVLVNAMIVEDDPGMRAVLTDLCGQLFTSVVEFDNGRDAVDQYDTCRPDYVLMDIRLPIMDGIEATRRIMALDPGARVYIITAYDDAAYRVHAMRAGARGYCLKDDLGVLMDTVSRDMQSA